jgi:hypothetical protein
VWKCQFKVPHQFAVGTAQVPSKTACYWHSLTTVEYVGSFDVPLNQFSITSNLYLNSFSNPHQAHGKTLVLKRVVASARIQIRLSTRVPHKQAKNYFDRCLQSSVLKADWSIDFFQGHHEHGNQTNLLPWRRLCRRTHLVRTVIIKNSFFCLHLWAVYEISYQRTKLRTQVQN